MLRQYVGDDAHKVMLDDLLRDTDSIYENYIKKKKKMVWDDEAKEKHRSATTCHICEKSLDIPPHVHRRGEDKKKCDICTHYAKVRDHDHFTGN